MYAISQLSGSGPSSSFSSGLGSVIFGDCPSSLGASGGASAGRLCGAASPEASVLLSSCSLDSEVAGESGRGREGGGQRDRERDKAGRDNGG